MRALNILLITSHVISLLRWLLVNALLTNAPWAFQECEILLPVHCSRSLVVMI